MSPEEDRTRDAVDSEPKHYQLSYSGPILIDLIDFFIRERGAWQKERGGGEEG